MRQLSDARFDDPLLNDAFDFSRYPIFKTNLTKPCTPYEARRSLFVVYGHESPSRAEPHQRQRNVSEPPLLFSSNRTREPWFSKVTSAHTIGDVAHLSSDESCDAIRPSQTITAICDTTHAHARSWFDVDDADVRLDETLGDIGQESNEHKEEDSFYSMESANQDAHPILLSMPIIPQIKLERKATVKKHDPAPPSDVARNQGFLSPRFRDLRTSRMASSHRYGRVPAETNPPAIRGRLLGKGGLGGLLFWHASRRLGKTRPGECVKNHSIPVACSRSVSEPMLNSSSSLDEEKEPLLKKASMKSHRSETSLSMIEGVPSPHSYKPGSHGQVEELSGLKRVTPEGAAGSHRRSSMCHSISFTSFMHAVAEGCASLDLLRKAKSKAKERKSQSGEHTPTPNPHNPILKWAPRQGQIIIKVFVPSTDDIWKFRVPQNIDLAGFTSRVIAKLGFVVCFSGSLWDEPRYYFRTDEQFAVWVRGRIRFGRNLPIVAHTSDSPSLVKLSMDGGGCEVRCYA